MNSCLPDVDDDRECEWDADDGEEDAEDAARRRHRRDVAVTCAGKRQDLHVKPTKGTKFIPFNVGNEECNL